MVTRCLNSATGALLMLLGGFLLFVLYIHCRMGVREPIDLEVGLEILARLFNPANRVGTTIAVSLFVIGLVQFVVGLFPPKAHSSPLSVALVAVGAVVLLSAFC